MESFLFYAFSGVVVVSSLFVVIHPQPTRALLALIVTMFSLAVLYVLLGAPFIAMAHLIVYAGAVLVLFLFVIMLMGIGDRDLPILKRFHPVFIPLVLLGSGAFLAALIHVLGSQHASLEAKTLGLFGSVEAVAQRLFNDFLLPFELTSLLLLLGIFAAVALAKKEAE